MRFKKIYKNKPALNLERELVKACLDYLTLRGYVAIRSNAGLIVIPTDRGKKRAVRLSPQGTPDIVACSPRGRFIAVECKTERGKVSSEQSVFLERLKERGAFVFVVRSVDELDLQIKQMEEGGQI